MMEWSSPCAAMQPPQWGLGRDLPAAARPRQNLFGSTNFNFRDMSMKRSQPDYFSPKHARGSSPTASLAADLSQNFHIDQSPQLPTPRRSLFTTHAFSAAADRAGTTTPPIYVEGVTTPPIVSSSPGFGNEMDYSPLPHKAPFSYAPQVTLQSPTPDASSVDLDQDVSMLSSSPAPHNSRLDVPRNEPAPERRKPSLLRPGLSRTKCFSTNSVAQRAKGEENQLPPFQFGAGTNAATAPSIPSLDECFTESPPQERINYNSTINPPRPRQLFPGNGLGRGGGSPGSNSMRRPIGPIRPRKQFRRSNSMFEHPGDVMKQEKKEYTPSGLQSIMDIDDTVPLKLKHFIPPDKPDSLPRIDQDTMISVLNGEYSHAFDLVMVVDCRFEYEFNGGHITGAVNYNDKEKLADDLFQLPSPQNTLLIFHCEYSIHRAPLMAKHIRKADREVNAEQYPMLSFPEVYILDGGYSSFFKTHRGRCFPQNYVGMDAKEHEHACERGMNKLRQRQKLSRAQTFAFGESNEVEDSPTGPQRSRTDGSVDYGSLLDPRPIHSRRMASY
ncbi:putative M-phase inducer phosphatase [Aulographum hederae CBS 113979]|uniref:M-phase inducer phosphatase n=1 Tax=Aulographum hederae CBS 113979 TaxID=1176131 RepID=A0A6G1GUK7_9PEZI|nr:putative M-phase inducer phosphatase [Aulographum hederae CBS 113979]